MTQPLMLLFYQKLFPGTHLVNRLQDLGYRVQTHSQSGSLVQTAEKVKPMIVIVDIGDDREHLCAAIERLKSNPQTSHLPVLAITTARDKKAQQMARDANATLVVHEKAVLLHLNHFLEQAFHID